MPPILPDIQELQINLHFEHPITIYTEKQVIQDCFSVFSYF